jgi:flagellar assembly protein FliH
MTLSYEPGRAASYTPLEYREAGDPAVQSPASSQAGRAAASQAEKASDPEALLRARLEAERRAITAQLRQEAEREIQHARAEIAAAIEQFEQQRAEYFRDAEGEIVGLALAITRRLLHRESQIDPHLLAGLVRYELDRLDAGTSVRLLVSPETLGYWTQAATTMPRPVEAAADKALGAGAVRIETALGSTTVGFERELKEIERGFFDLLSHRPVAVETARALVQ